jgi:hypothetical protein
MNMISVMANGRCEARIQSLRSEFGATLAARIIESEAADFLWEARIKERYLGQHIDVGLGIDDEEAELSRIAMLSFLDGRWYSGTCLVDGEGLSVDLLWKQSFDSRAEAEAVFDRAA